jgi:hypothetical protein
MEFSHNHYFLTAITGEVENAADLKLGFPDQGAMKKHTFRKSWRHNRPVPIQAKQVISVDRFDDNTNL